ncbi:MAG: VCBS repeat-containing protein [Verrucomicrobiales bacterium]|nr:VCBS repeat-containing protein [Verrucomicrobiales bacterium]
MKSLITALGLFITSGLSQGSELWKKHIIQPKTLSGINSAVANDWNGDGHIDVISCFGKHVYLFAGPDWKRTSIFSLSEAHSRNKLRGGCIHSCLMDVDADGDLDFIGSSNTVFWLECPETPFLSQWKYRLVDDQILGTHCLITGDVNLDGKTDLIANSGRNTGTPYPNSIAWLEVPDAPGKSSFWKRHIFAHEDAPGGSHYTGIADINGDGRPDISCGAKGGAGYEGGEWFAWWEQPGDPTGIWKKNLLSSQEPGASNILPADLNGDGKMDFFATRGHGTGVVQFIQQPSSTEIQFKQIEVDRDIVAPHSLSLVDLDADGDIDAVTCGKEADGVAAWYRNDGSANFTKHIIGLNQGSYDTRTIDMDGDGDLDILIAGHASNNIVWFENNLLNN